jgi:hypothetical protein
MKLRLLVRSDNLGDADESAKGGRVEDSITVALTCGLLVRWAISRVTAIVAISGHVGHT